MQINPSSGFTGVNPTPAGAAAAGSGSKGVKLDAPSGGEDSTFTPTPDLARLLEAVRELPDIRPEAVSAATDLVASGELLGPAAASETAQAILASPFPGD